MKAWAVCGATAVAASLSCQQGSAPTPLDDRSPNVDSTRPNYADDVYPIIANACVPCHLGGGVASLPLVTADLAAQQAQHLRHAVLTREMPPWGVENDGSCGEWIGARWLKAEDIATVVAWVDNGAVPGGSVTQIIRHPPLDQPHPDAMTLRVGRDYQPGLGPAAERCFVVDPALSADAFVNGIGFGGGRLARQVTLYSLDTPEMEARASGLDGQTAEPGYPCSGTSGVEGARLVTGVTWNTPVLRLPAGTGVRLAAGRKLVAQIQYELFLRSSANEVLVELELAPNARAGKWIELRVAPLTIPDDAIDATAVGRMVAPKAFSALAVYPQMRRLGKSLDVTLDREGGVGQSCMVRQLNWTYDMVREPRVYAVAPTVAAGDLLTLTCHYNTQGRSAIHGGDSPDDEDCAIDFFSTD